MTFIKNSLILLTIFLLANPTFTSASSGKNIFQKYAKSTVYIEAYDNTDTHISQGSGFYIEKNKVVTNFHVIKNSTYLLIYNINGESTYCNKVCFFDIDNDIAILKIDSQETPLKINYKYAPAIGDSVFVISSPRGFKFTISDGILSGIRSIRNIKLYQMTAPISPGSSGGAVLDENGYVIGIASSYFKDGQNINFSIPITYLNKKIAIDNQILLSEIEDPDLALDNLFLTIFDRIYYGMSEEEFLDALQGCKHVRHEQKDLDLKPLAPESRIENSPRKQSFFETIDEVIGHKNVYKIDDVRVIDIYFNFEFTFHEYKNNSLTSILADSQISANSKYCYASMIEYLGTKFNKFRKISEQENKQLRKNIPTQLQGKGYEKFFTQPTTRTRCTSWIINDSLLSIKLIDDKKIHILWMLNIYE